MLDKYLNNAAQMIPSFTPILKHEIKSGPLHYLMKEFLESKGCIIVDCPSGATIHMPRSCIVERDELIVRDDRLVWKFPDGSQVREIQCRHEDFSTVRVETKELSAYLEAKGHDLKSSLESIASFYVTGPGK